MRKFFTYTDRVVPVHHPRVLVATAVEQGAEPAALFANTNMTPEMLANPETRISYLEYAAFVRNALRATKNPALGLDVGCNIHFPQMGALGLALMSSPTAGDALQASIRYARLLSPALDFAMQVDADRGTFTVREVLPLAPYHVFATEMVLAAFYGQGSALIGGPLPIRCARFTFPAPAYAERYRQLLHAPVFFDQDVSQAEFDASALAQVVPHADPATAKLAEQICAQLSLAHAPGEGLMDQVRHLLLRTPARPPDLEALARTLQTSTRSLRRALQEMGSSYHELLDDCRRRRAEEWVRATPMTFEEIGERVGFSNARSFRRAFKRWTGATPIQYRAANGLSVTTAADDTSLAKDRDHGLQRVTA